MRRPARPTQTRTFGPAFDEGADGVRVRGQLRLIRDFMLATPETWNTLAEIECGLALLYPGTLFPTPSISAQLRNLRKAAFGSYHVEKRRVAKADGSPSGLWEYRVLPPAPETPAGYLIDVRPTAAQRMRRFG